MAGTLYCLFDDSGSIKSATVKAEAEASLQVELGSGRRLKIKRSQVFLNFTSPAPEALMDQAQAEASGLDPSFLWDCAPEAEFTHTDFAREVYGDGPSAAQQAGLLFALQSAPMYFYRKGKGVFRKAPAEALQAALAGAEKRARLAAEQAALEAELLAGRLPESIQGQAVRLLTRPDKQSVAHKALEAVAHQLQTTPARLMLGLGALPSAYALHRARFLAECFPQGADCPVTEAELDQMRQQHQALLAKLPKASEPAYSLDDASTDEVDDAFSLLATDEGWRVGVHIAAPGLLIKPDSGLGQAARDRASTVYFPGEKITMLPRPVVALASLDEGRWQLAASLYLEFDRAGTLLRHSSRLEQVYLQQNIRHGDWEADFDRALQTDLPETERALAADRLPWSGLLTLHELAMGLRRGREAVRGRPEPVGRTDFQFSVAWQDHPDAQALGLGRPEIGLRTRGSPVDVLVSEFMILTNVRWGETLALAQLPGIYRCQSMGRVRMQTQPSQHQGLGVSHYAWSTSPLRRFSDLLNQWQLLSVLGHGQPRYKNGDAQLFADLAQFEAAYERYGEFQSSMERYWAQRILGLEAGLSGESWDASDAGAPLVELGVTTRQEGVVRLRRLPVTVRVSGWHELPPGTPVELVVLRSDALDLQLEARGQRVLPREPSARMAVLGDPIAHSLSPNIHQQFAEQLGLVIDYQAIQTPAQELADRLQSLHEAGYRGLNLTVPLKEVAFELAQRAGWPLSERARAAKAVNTLVAEDSGWSADNTDGAGLVQSLTQQLSEASLSGRQLLLIGAGGAARGVIAPLFAAGLHRLVLVNRSQDRAEQLARDFPDLAIQVWPWSAMVMDHQPDGQPWPGLVVNASSASLEGASLAISPQLLASSDLVLDMMYDKTGAETAFLQQAAQAGAGHRADGLGMLVGQAAESFALWMGQRPESAPVMAQLQAAFQAAAEPKAQD